MSHLNWNINPDAMEKLYKVAKPIAVFCGKVALIQIRKELYFLQEQPHPSSLYDEEPWPGILKGIKLGFIIQVFYDRLLTAITRDS